MLWRKLRGILTPDWRNIAVLAKPVDATSEYEDASKKTDTALLALLGFCLFCALSLLGTPDPALLQSGATVSIPFGGTSITFAGFLLAGPLILLALTVYLHVYLGFLRTLRSTMACWSGPALINLPGWPARLLVEVIAYWIAPATIILFFWKAIPFNDSAWLGSLGVALFATLTIVAIRRRHRDHFNIFDVGRALLFCTSIVLFYGFTVTALRPTPVDRLGYEYRKLYRSTSLRSADLSGKQFSGSFLREVDLSFANLHNSIFVGVNMEGAVLDNANLQNADLTGALLSGISVENADFLNAKLHLALIPWNVDFRLTKNLTQAQIDDACLATDLVGQKIILPPTLTPPKKLTSECKRRLENYGQFSR